MQPTKTCFLIGASGAVLVAGLCIGVLTPVRLHDGTPGTGAWLPTSTLKAQVQWTGWVRGVEARVDGHDVPVESDPSTRTATLEVAGLADGVHDFKIVFHQAFALGDRVWGERVHVASHPPQVSWSVPAVVTDRNLMIEGQATPDARVAVNGGAPVEVGPTGRFSLSVPLVEGRQQLELVATNRAGVARRATRTVLCDTTPPAIQPAEMAKRITTDRPELQAQVEDAGTGVATVAVQVDDAAPVQVWKGSSHQVAVHWKCPELPEGRRSVKWLATDGAGLQSQQSIDFVVDSTETLGEKTMTSGALGADVADLQKHLIHQGWLARGHVTQVFDDLTVDAVKRFEEHWKLKADGVVGPACLADLLPHIVVDLDRFQLVLVEGDKVVKRYSVARGMPAHPTPVGEFRVAEMVKDPPWIPPKNSLWAREAKTIPPGPGNPLGTRWIGLNSDVVGIHGTNADWSIGTASSHGCVRMHIPDVEDLYKRVNVGALVTIFQGTEKSALIRRLWPAH